MSKLKLVGDGKVPHVGVPVQSSSSKNTVTITERDRDGLGFN